MNGTVTRAVSARLYSRALILSGTALGSILISSPALAQNVSYNGPGDYTLSDAGTYSGGPRTIDVTTTSGNIDIDVGTVNTTNNGSTLGAGIAATNTGPGNVAVKAGTVTASGTGQTYGIDARTGGGNITIETGTVTSNSNPNSRGIYAVAGGGDISIIADTTNGGQRGIFTGTNNGIFPNVTTIVSNVATANGTNTPNGSVRATAP